MSLITYVDKAQAGDHKSMDYLYQKFYPLLLKEASRYGILDKDCLQDLSEKFIHLILNFDASYYL